MMNVFFVVFCILGKIVIWLICYKFVIRIRLVIDVMLNDDF